MWEKAQYGEMGSSAGFKERLTDWVQVCWGEGFGREGSPDEGDGPGWRKGAKGRKEAQFQGWGWVAGVVKEPEGAMEDSGGRGLAAGRGRRPLELRRGWGRGACAGPLPVLGVYHPRWLCSGWEEAARGVGRWTSEWVWGRARGPVSAG